jgi:integrase
LRLADSRSAPGNGWRRGDHEHERLASGLIPAQRDDARTPALKAAGLTHRGPYALRHTYAAFAIAAALSLYELARFMGTSVEQIDKTYGHLLPDSIDGTRAAIDSFVARADESAEDAQ